MKRYVKQQWALYLNDVQVALLGGDVQRTGVILVTHVDQTLHLRVRQ